MSIASRFLLSGLVPMLLAAGLTAHAEARTRAGVVVLANGAVHAQADGDRRALQRRSKIFEGDTVVTGSGAKAQIRLKDKGLVSLKSSTRFAIERYRTEEADGEDSAAMKLLKGAMRTVTGSVGRESKENYEMDTPVASIGIRGTDYSLRHCPGTCRTVGGGEVDSGSYGSVHEGAVQVSNEGGRLNAGAGTTFHASSANAPPRTMEEPPEDLFEPGSEEDDEDGEDEGGEEDEGADGKEADQEGESEDKEGEDGEDGGEGDAGEEGNDAAQDGQDSPSANDGGDGTDSGSSAGTTGDGGEGGSLEDMYGGEDLEYSTAEDVDAAGNPQNADLVLEDPTGTVVTFTDAEVTTNDNDEVTNMLLTDQDTGDTVAFEATGTSVQESGKASGLGVHWGRWAEGDYQVTRDGEVQNTHGDFHYAYADQITTTGQLASLEGQVTYSFADGTTPTDHNGDAWTLDRLAMDVDFGSGRITGADLDLSDADGSQFELSETFNVEANPVFFVPLEGTFDHADASVATTDAEGVLSGQFAGDEAQGAAVVYRVQDGDRTVFVTGSGLLRR